MTVGCAYSLGAERPAYTVNLRIIASSPERYIIRQGYGSDQRISGQGKISVVIPSIPRGCSVYLFDVIPVHHQPNPQKKWKLRILDNKGRILRTFTVTQLEELALDADGYHLLKMDD
jgi:hypothetical protein